METYVLIKNLGFERPNSTFIQKLSIRPENPGFGRKPRFWTKSQVLDEKPGFGRKPRFWTKTQVFKKENEQLGMSMRE